MTVRNFQRFFLVTFFVMVLGFAGCSLQKDSSESKNDTVNSAVQEQDLSVTLTVEGVNYPATLGAGSNALQLLQQVTTKENIVLQTKTYSFGTSVETIGDKTNGQGNKYWIYYVNDTAGTTSLDAYKLQNGDKVRLSFEESK